MTGRKVMEYAGKYGVCRIYSVIVAMIFFFISAALSYEVVRVFKAFDYRTWIKQILWKFWPKTWGIPTLFLFTGIWEGLV